MRTTCRLKFSPASCTVSVNVNPAFLKARNDLRLRSSGSVITVLNAQVFKDDLHQELADYNRSQSQTRHCKFPNCEVD
jgi:hypothetical protein